MLNQTTAGKNSGLPTPTVSAPPRVRLVLRGDDAGSSDTANRAIALACRARALRNVSIMASGPAFGEVARLLGDVPELCLGLHVCLNSEWASPRWGPVLGADKVPSLVGDDGQFLRRPEENQARGFNLAEMLAEVRAQLDRLRQAKLTIRYMDEHMGVGWLPGLRDGLCRLAEREGLIAVETLGMRWLPRAQGTNKADPIETLSARLAAITESGNYLLVTHPEFSLSYRQWPGGQADAEQRDADRRLLVDPRLPGVCAAAGVELVRFPEVVNPSAGS